MKLILFGIIFLLIYGLFSMKSQAAAEEFFNSDPNFPYLRENSNNQVGWMKGTDAKDTRAS